MHPDWIRTSYSQFGEDAVIQAYLRGQAYGLSGDQLAYKRDGFYVDIGCFHPELISNTMWLHEQGWRGINIDATPGVKEVFDTVRPDDINLHLAMSDRDGEISFYSFGPHSVLNTVDASSRSPSAETVIVPAMRLDTMLNAYLPAGRSVDILSIDVEGHDLQVLGSGNWEQHRPDLVLVEHHETNIGAICASEVHSFMVSKGYALYAWTPPTLIFKRQP